MHVGSLLGGCAGRGAPLDQRKLCGPPPPTASCRRRGRHSTHSRHASPPVPSPRAGCGPAAAQRRLGTGRRRPGRLLVGARSRPGREFRRRPACSAASRAARRSSTRASSPTACCCRAGRVKVIATTANGREVVLGFRGPGELVGDQSALDGVPRSATSWRSSPSTRTAVPAGLPCVPHGAPGGGADAVADAEPPLARRRREADRVLRLNTIARVAARLLELSDRFGARREQDPHPPAALAGGARGRDGSSLESVGRALQTMRTLNCIETRRRDIRILDREALDALRHAAADPPPGLADRRARV